MRHLDLFSGLCGFSIAVEMVWPEARHIFCDIDPFSQALARKHWPLATIYGDIKKLHAIDIGAVDLVTGGFPCQPFSKAGNRLGTADDRNLWPEMLRVIREVSPKWVLAENVDGILTWNDGVVFEQVCADLEDAGYSVQSFVIPASAVGAFHRRDRVWFLAHADGIRLQAGIREKHRRPASQRLADTNDARRRSTHVADTDSINGKGSDTETTERWKEERRPTRLRRRARAWPQEWPTEPRLGRVAHGIPNRVDRIKALGNAIVPQVAAQIMRAIRATDTV